MSWPGFLGNYFPGTEDLIAAVDTGDGTGYPILWNKTNGATTDDQMCQFEWTLLKLTAEVEGDVTLTFNDHTGGGGAPTQATVHFHVTFVTTRNPPGATWSDIEPADFVVGTGGALCGIGGASVSFPVVLPWGADTAEIGMVGSVSDLRLVQGTTDTYTKAIEIALQATTGSGDSSIQIGISAGGIGFATQQGFATEFLHAPAFVALPAIYVNAPGGLASITLSTFSLTVTDKKASP